jgi:hypothetical protein
MMTKYRITPQFSLNGFTGTPETNYMLEKRVWGRWEGVQMYITAEEAEEQKRQLVAAEYVKRSWPI